MFTQCSCSTCSMRMHVCISYHVFKINSNLHFLLVICFPKNMNFSILQKQSRYSGGKFLKYFKRACISNIKNMLQILMFFARRKLSRLLFIYAALDKIVFSYTTVVWKIFVILIYHTFWDVSANWIKFSSSFCKFTSDTSLRWNDR